VDRIYDWVPGKEKKERWGPSGRPSLTAPPWTPPLGGWVGKLKVGKVPKASSAQERMAGFPLPMLTRSAHLMPRIIPCALLCRRPSSCLIFYHI
jgi:hypothetical protein